MVYGETPRKTKAVQRTKRAMPARSNKGGALRGKARAGYVHDLNQGADGPSWSQTARSRQTPSTRRGRAGI